MPRLNVDDCGREIDRRPIAETPLFALERSLEGPGGARDSDPETSHRAASKKKSVTRWGSHRARLLQAFGDLVDATDEEAGIFAGLHERHICYWKRCSELRLYGLIEPTGETRLSLSKNEVMVCAITQAGKNLLDSLFSLRGRMPNKTE